MSENTTNETVNETTEQTEEVAAAPKLGPLTPYAAWKVAEAVLTARSLDSSKLAPQRFYGMAKKGQIATVQLAGDKKVYFDGEAFKTWLTAYMTGTAQVGGRQNYDKLAEQYM